MDNLITCPCWGSDACSKNETDQGNAYLCWTCGFTTNDNMEAVMTKHEAATETTPAVPATITGTDGLFGLKSYLGNYLGTGTVSSSFRLSTKIVRF